jgi:biotin carboxyl carrier protein
VLCILEAMKIMNEITAEEDGQIIDVCVNNGEIVEYSQTLFKIAPA